jgi:hypothetical protein
VSDECQTPVGLVYSKDCDARVGLSVRHVEERAVLTNVNIGRAHVMGAGALLTKHHSESKDRTAVKAKTSRKKRRQRETKTPLTPSHQPRIFAKASQVTGCRTDTPAGVCLLVLQMRAEYQ